MLQEVQLTPLIKFLMRRAVLMKKKEQRRDLEALYVMMKNKKTTLRKMLARLPRSLDQEKI